MSILYSIQYYTVLYIIITITKMNNTGHMQFSHNVKTISEYNTLLGNLNPLGRYQIRLYLLCMLYWLLAGIYATCFELAFAQFQCPYALGAFQGAGILVFSWLAYIKGRKFSTVAASIFALIGYVLLLLYLLDPGNPPVGIFGIAMIGLATYSQPILLLSIICQLTTLRIIQVVLCLSLGCYCLGRVSIIAIFDVIRDAWGAEGEDAVDKFVGLLVVAPGVALSVLMGLFVRDSPRYFIENDIHKAEELIKRIIKVNTGKDTEVSNHIDENFVLKRINLRRYNYLTLTKYPSFGFPQYCLMIVMLLLGIVGREPKYIFHARSQMASKQIQIIWISGFELVGILASAFFLTFCKRRLTCILSSLLISLMATTLYFLSSHEIYSNLVLLGLNAVFSIVLFTFLVATVIEFYPHSVRTFGLGLMLSLYYFGQLLVYLYWDYSVRVEGMLEMFLLGAWIMFLHCWGLPEMLGRDLGYQIKEIEEEEEQDNI